MHGADPAPRQRSTDTQIDKSVSHKRTVDLDPTGRVCGDEVLIDRVMAVMVPIRATRSKVDSLRCSRISDLNQAHGGNACRSAACTVLVISMRRRALALEAVDGNLDNYRYPNRGESFKPETLQAKPDRRTFFR